MGKSVTENAPQSRATYEVLEEITRLKGQEYIQNIFNEKSVDETQAEACGYGDMKGNQIKAQVGACAKEGLF